MRILRTTPRTWRSAGIAFCAFLFVAVAGFAQTSRPAEASAVAPAEQALWHLLIVEVSLVAITLLMLPVLAWWLGKGQDAEKRGLGLPRGSVRGILALLIVGSTINGLLFGAAAFGDHFGEIVAALVALSGSVVGFYFGGRTATPVPTRNSETNRQDDGT